MIEGFVGFLLYGYMIFSFCKMDFSIKKRLVDFFREANEILQEDYIQMTFEESKEISDYIKKKCKAQYRTLHKFL